MLSLWASARLVFFVCLALTPSFHGVSAANLAARSMPSQDQYFHDPSSASHLQLRPVFPVLGASATTISTILSLCALGLHALIITLPSSLFVTFVRPALSEGWSNIEEVRLALASPSKTATSTKSGDTHVKKEVQVANARGEEDQIEENAQEKQAKLMRKQHKFVRTIVRLNKINVLLWVEIALNAAAMVLLLVRFALVREHTNSHQPTYCMFLF
jgi:hypothetical protein